jgi:hypothetical protein
LIEKLNKLTGTWYEYQKRSRSRRFFFN